MTDLRQAEQDERALADLANFPGFGVLIRRLRLVETDALGFLKAETNPVKAHALLRYWQFMSRFIDILEEAPSAADSFLRQELENAQRSEAEQMLYDVAPRFLNSFNSPQVTMNIEETNE
jgi:hypothetical protein